MNRENKLKEKFNKFLASKFHIDEEDYYKKLNTEDFFEWLCHNKWLIFDEK